MKVPICVRRVCEGRSFEVGPATQSAAACIPLFPGLKGTAWPSPIAFGFHLVACIALSDRLSTVKFPCTNSHVFAESKWQ